MYQLFLDRHGDDTCDPALERLQIRLSQEGLIDLHTWVIHSIAVRATQNSSGAEKRGGLEESLDHALGRGQSSLMTNIHMACDVNGLPLRTMPRKPRPGLPRLFDRQKCRQRNMSKWTFVWII